MSAPYPIEELMQRTPSAHCVWGGADGFAERAPLCQERPAYRCVVTGPDDVGDLCRAHVVDITEAITRMAEDMPWLGTVVVAPLEAR